MPALIVKGNRVSFLRESDGKEFVLPPHYCIVQDPTGQLVRGCDFFIVPTVFVRPGISGSDRQMRNIAEAYYGNCDDLCEVRVDLPMGGWKNPQLMTTIRYWREGFLKTPPGVAGYEHVYATPQPLYANPVHNSFKIVSPDHCIANERGFVHP